MSKSIIVSKLRHGFLVTLRDRETGEGIDDVAACSHLDDLTQWMRGHFEEPAPVFNIDVRGVSKETLASLAAELDARIAPSSIQTGIHDRPSHSDESSPEAGPQAQASLVGTDTGTPADREGRDEGEAVEADLPTNQPETASRLPAQESGGTEASSESEPLGKPNAARPASVDAHVNDGSAAGEVAYEVVTGGESAASISDDETAAERFSSPPLPPSGGEEKVAPVSVFGDLTVSQRRVLDHLRLCAQKTASETVTIDWKMLADKAAVPTTSVYTHCDALQKKGLIDVRKNGPGVAPTFAVHGALELRRAS